MAATSLVERARIVNESLRALYPGSAKELCALSFRSPFELLVATVLSAQTTDAVVNGVTAGLFDRYPDPVALAGASLAELEHIVYSTGFYRTKAQHLLGLAEALVARFGGEVPTEMADLTTLPGVGRKTANVVRSVAFGLPGLPVDTHVARVSRRIGLTRARDPEAIEADLTCLLPESDWGAFSLRMIQHGRRVCTAKAPSCFGCQLAPWCEHASEQATGVGRAEA